MDSDWTVFKAVNRRRKEIFIGATRLPVFETWAELRHARPDFADWRGEAVSVETLEAGVTRRAALALVSRRIKVPPPKGWRLLK